jgi:hypothetical protein
MSDTVEQRNLDHALEDACTDPDCEIHNIEVAWDEQVISKTDIAMFVAGYFAGAAAMADQFDTVKDNLRDEVAMMFQPREGKA